MYLYDAHDQRLIDERVVQFRDQTRRYLDGKLGEEQFKPLRLLNGLYVERNAPMLRIAIPYGVLSSAQMRMLARITRVYDRGYGHFTTRQNLQINWPAIERVPDILADLASVQMHAIQTSGNCVRNITTDHLAGIAPDEVADPRPYCELMRQWSTLHPEFSFLPRKFKIAVTGARSDRAASEVHDIGLHLVRDTHGAIGFEVLVGGGLGRTPVIGRIIRDFLPERHLLSYLEAILRVYNLLGRRDNKHKARIKILLRDTGLEKFQALVEGEWAEILAHDPGLALGADEIAAMAASFRVPAFETRADAQSLRHILDGNARLARWVEQNTTAHKHPGYRAVYVSLKAPGRAPGDASAGEMEAIAHLAERHSAGEIRTTHTQNLLLPHVALADLPALWKRLEKLRLASANIGTVQDLICCPGLEFCSLANASSIPIAMAISERFDDLDHLYDLGDIQIKISGCMNACGHHHVGHIGILGVEKRGEEWYQVTLGGSAGKQARLGTRLGPALSKDQIVDAVERIVETFVAHRLDGEPFLATLARIGIDPFKEQVYA